MIPIPMAIVTLNLRRIVMRKLQDDQFLKEKAPDVRAMMPMLKPAEIFESYQTAAEVTAQETQLCNAFAANKAVITAFRRSLKDALSRVGQYSD